VQILGATQPGHVAVFNRNNPLRADTGWNSMLPGTSPFAVCG